MLTRLICLVICHCQHNDNVLRVTKMSSYEEIRWLGPHSCSNSSCCFSCWKE